jgi:hypothetical protein
MARTAPDAVMCSSIRVFEGDAHIAMTAGHRVVFNRFWEHLLLKLRVCLQGS